MNPEYIEQLNKDFSIKSNTNSLCFIAGDDGIALVEIKNDNASAVISLQGAHLLSWVPNNQDDVIWLSKKAIFKQGKSVRGGIPICWPWFGAHESDQGFPPHGFARTVFWQVVVTSALPNGETKIVLRLDTSQLSNEIQNMWPQDTVAEYCICIGESLSLELITHNKSDLPITIGQALHTYFNVQDVSATTIKGLEDKDYLDKPDNFTRKTQTGPVTINEEVDRIYLNTSDDVSILTETRTVNISKQGSASTVVWNPWSRVADKMGDLGESGYLRMLCVESANAADDVRVIDAGQKHRLFVCYTSDLC